ncbi:MAG TPA: PAS domain S-box protein, partial [Longimicrobiaceae bacterium]|nr:PAS domain S-box protein [Longimicrobiaceae bacterium]
MEAPVLPHEQERLAALRGYGVLDTPPEPEFDSLTRLASQICGTPMALLTLVDGERQWFKSRVGIDIAETPRELSFCAHAIERPGLFVVTDTLEDERFSTNPLVLSIPYVRFYAGAPLVTPEGHGLGTLCVVDRVPRNLSSEQLEALRTLARQAMGQLELRRQLRRLQEMVALQDRAEAARAAYAARTARQNAALVQLARLDEADLDGLLREVTRSGSHTLDVERVGVWLFRDGGEVMECAALYRRAEDDHESGVRIPSGAYPAYFAALAESRALAAEDARTDPRTRELAATYLEPLGIGAMLDVPVWRDGTLAGVVCHEHVGPPRAWADDERRFAADLADVVTIALQAHDRRRAEEDLLRARVRAAAVMRAALDCVVVMGADGRVLDFNPAAEATFGYTAAEAMGRDARDLIVPERLRDAAGRYLAEAGGQVLGRRLETTGMRKDGTELPLEMTLTRVPLDGPPIFTAHLRDITERVEGAAALDRSVSLLRATLESTADGLLAVDHAGAVLASNAKFAEMWGLSPNTVKAGDGAALAGACEKVVDAEAFMARICELYGCPEAESFDEIRLRDGRVLERYSQPQRVNGETVGRVWSFRDVTERRHAEADARSTAERMRAVASAAAAVVGAASRAELRQVLEEACRRVLSFDAFFIFGYDAGAHTFTGFGGHDAGVYSPPDVSSAAAGTPGERVVRERRSLLTLSSADPAGKGAEPAGTGRRAESAIRTPIVAGDEVLGIVSVQSYTPGLYGPRDVEVVEALASLAATALRNLRLTEERSAAQDALRRSESRFRALFEQFPFSIQIFSPQGRTLEVNRAWERMFGMGVDDVRGFNPLDDPQLREIAPLVRRGFEGRGGDLPPTLFDAGLAVRTRARPASNGSAGSPASTAEPRPSRSDDTTASAEAIGASESADAALSPESTEVAAESTEVTASPDSTEPIASTESPGSAESASSVGWAASTEAAASSESVASTEWTRTEDAGASAESAGVGDAGASMEATPSAESIGEAGCVDVVASTDAGPTAERAVMAAVVSEIAETSGEEAAASARSPAVDGETEDADAPAERADGRRAAERRAVGPRWIKASICPVKDEAGAIAEVILVHQDVTVERDAERALREARDELERRVEERTAELAETNMAMEEEIAERARAEEELVQKSAELEAVFHALPDLYIRMEPDGTIRDCQAGNDAARYATPAEYVGRRITEVLPPGPAAQMADALRRTVECGSLVQAEYALPADDGAREFEARLLPLEAGGQVVAVVREITERKGWERELKRREEHFRTLIENGTDLIAIIDRAGVTRYLSPSATRLLGWDTAERVGRSSVEMVHPDDREKVASLRDYALAHPGESFEVEYRYRHGDGSWRVFEAAARTLLPESGDEGLVVNAR